MVDYSNLSPGLDLDLLRRDLDCSSSSCDSTTDSSHDSEESYLDKLHPSWDKYVTAGSTKATMTLLLQYVATLQEVTGDQEDKELTCNLMNIHKALKNILMKKTSPAQFQPMRSIWDMF